VASAELGPLRIWQALDRSKLRTMTLPYSLVCDLLEALSREATAGKQHQSRGTLHQWFHHHRQQIDALDSRAGVALLSTLLPAKRTDRVYCIQTTRLEKIFKRAQSLGVGRMRELERYKVPGSGVDLADCIFSILRATVRRISLPFILGAITAFHYCPDA
jgi:DNA ligase-4